MTEEEDQYMDWTVGGAEDQESAAPMAARLGCIFLPRLKRSRICRTPERRHRIPRGTSKS